MGEWQMGLECERGRRHNPAELREQEHEQGGVDPVADGFAPLLLLLLLRVEVHGVGAARDGGHDARVHQQPVVVGESDWAATATATGATAAAVESTLLLALGR